MKRLLTLSIALVCLAGSLSAQTRKLRPDEIDFYNNLHPVLYDAIPHTYKDWKANGDKREFDAIKFFCPVVYADNDCTGKCPVSLGVGDPYQHSLSVDFKMPGSEQGAIQSSAMAGLKDFNDPMQVATMLKSVAKTKLAISVNVNVSTPGIAPYVLSYCSKLTPETIELPITATLAIMGVKSPQCPIMSGSRVNMSPGDGYYDNAIIFLGKPVAIKKTGSGSDGQARTDYGIGFDKTKIGSPIVQNMVVTLKGDADDIRAAIKLIDWQKLNALIAK